MNLHSLHVGINYKGTSSELFGCVNDARDWAKRLKPFAASQIVLTEKQATREGIERAVKKLKARLEPGDEVVFTNSSHGTRDLDTSGDERTGYDQAMVCYGFDLFYDDELAGQVNDRPPRVPVFLFFDSCHSGTPQRGVHRQPRTVSILRCREHKRERSGLVTRSLEGVLSFSGCQDGPSSYCYDAAFGRRANGAATYFALASLDQLPPRPSYRRWFTRLANCLPSEDYDQTPTIHGAERLRSRTISFAAAAD